MSKKLKTDQCILSRLYHDVSHDDTQSNESNQRTNDDQFDCGQCKKGEFPEYISLFYTNWNYSSAFNPTHVAHVYTHH